MYLRGRFDSTTEAATTQQVSDKGDPMEDRRTARLNEQFKREISDVLRTEVRDPRIGLPTVTGVEVTPDLWSAKVHVRPGPGAEGENVEEELLAGLVAATPFIRRELGSRLTLRRIPELRFVMDRTLDHALRIEKLLREVLPEEDSESAKTSGPSSSDEGSVQE